MCIGSPNVSGLFDAFLTLCYIESPCGKFFSAMRFAQSANLD
jgi:hypothetical protein